MQIYDNQSQYFFDLFGQSSGCCKVTWRVCKVAEELYPGDPNAYVATKLVEESLDRCVPDPSHPDCLLLFCP